MVPHNDLQCLGGDAGIDESMSTAAADIVGASVFSALRRSRVVRAAILGAWGLQTVFTAEVAWRRENGFAAAPDN